jgi:hypothetical protein
MDDNEEREIKLESDSTYTFYCLIAIHLECFSFDIKLSQCVIYITGIPYGESKSESEYVTVKIEESCEAQSNRTGDGKTEIKQESDDTYTSAYSVIFKEELDEVKEEITEEEGEIYEQINEGADRATNEGEDFKVVEMKDEEEEDNNSQVTTQVLKLFNFSLYLYMQFIWTSTSQIRTFTSPPTFLLVHMKCKMKSTSGLCLDFQCSII